MPTELIYDAATMSRAPEHAFALAGLLCVVAVALWGWQRVRRPKAAALTGWFATAALIFTAVAWGLVYERHLIASATDLRLAQGPLQAPWQDRVLRAGERNSYWEWQGFSVGGVAFAYVRNAEQNYFNNTGAQTLELREGLPLRVHWVERIEGGEPRRFIVRIERLTTAR